jgi:hypothetical protein
MEVSADSEIVLQVTQWAAEISAGGNLRTMASPMTTGRRYIWIRYPRADTRRPMQRKKCFFGRFRLDTGAVSTSGGDERFFHLELF